ncbi:RNA-binding domain-containing protein [Rickenella mellea]|uniref:RNA-binding domain-containing protein n=1 Tax=Rickenella mellea TaxID=50990 RepID=A0A4Y7PFV3_9AGAM|nr:RNA-binding domain-containing protein [Rickenella mellea]
MAKVERKPKTDKVAAKAGGKDKKAAKVAAAPLHSKEILANAAKLKKPVPAKKPSSSDSDETSSDSDSDTKTKTVPKANGKSPAKPAPPPTVDSDDDSSDDSSEDEKPKAAQVKTTQSPSKATKIATPAKASVQAKPAATSSSSSEEVSSEDEDSKKTAAKPKAAAAVPVKAKAKDTSDSDDSEESSEDDTPKIAPKDAKKESADSSDDSDDEDEDMEDATSAPVHNGKRKADEAAEAPAKKAKVANGDVHASAEGDEATKSIFVGRLSWNVDNDWLAQEFAECGEVVSARVQMDRNTGKSRGFGYVEFATAEAVEKAVALNGKEIDGRAVNIDKSSPRAPNPEKRAKAFGDVASEPSSTLFVGNVSFDTTEDNLWEVFAEYGEVKSVRLPTDRDTQRPKGFGYVEFTDLESAKKAFESAQGLDVQGRPIRLDYSQPRSNDGGGGRGRGGFGGGRGSFGGDRGSFGGDRGYGGRGGGRGRGGDRGRGGRGGRGGDRGGRGGRGAPRGGARTGGAVAFEGRKMTFD